MRHLIQFHLLSLAAFYLTTGISMVGATSVDAANPEARRLEVLFLGSPNSSHRPLDRFRTIRRALGAKGINFTYYNFPTALNKETLAKYDALLVYGNHLKLEKDQETALLEYSSNGGACVFLHSACGCFRNSEPFIKLLGAQFKSHGRGVFRVKTVKPNHPVMKGYEGFECWDETYIHHMHNEDRTVLQKHEEEPWTWVRTNDKGRVFYTASGHDERCWSLPAYHDLVLRGILWSVGDKKAALLKKLNIPKLSYKASPTPIIPGKNWGPQQDRRIPATHFQLPLPVKESLKLSQIPVDCQLEVFASEPDIINPIAINWDEKGRLWAVEAYDYPNSFVMNKPGRDRIKILEDTNKDGQADKITVFADGLSICTSVLPVKNGCITTDGTHMIELTDSDGDGKADKRRIIFSGISLRDTHACVSNIRYGFDGWIYATVGYSGVKTEVAGKKHAFAQGVFRFKQDGSDFEFIQGTTNNTWGLGLTEQGDITGSTANNNPSWFVSAPNRLYQGTSLKQPRTPRADSIDKIFPLTYDYLQVDCRDGVTAGAGHSIYTARIFPRDWWNQRVLICAPTGKLVAAPRIEARGDGFKTFAFEQNIYASADAWSAPVAAEVGPDGTVWIADWYNSIVQHNVYAKNQKRGKGNAYINDHRDRQHGRIYRISPKKSSPSSQPKLSSSTECVEALSNDNLFWRLTAQRLLTERQAKDAIPALYDLAQKKEPNSSVHALHLLNHFGETASAKFQSILADCLSSKDRGIVQAALSMLDPDPKHIPLVLARWNSPDRIISKHAAFYLCELTPSEETGMIIATMLGSANHKKQNLHIIHLVAHRHRNHVLKYLLTSKNQLQKNKTTEQFLKSLHDALKRDKNYLKPETVTALANSDAEFAQHITAIIGTGRIIKKIPLSESAKRGKEVYTLSCVACHQPNGMGLEKTFPPLAESEWLRGDPEKAVRIVLKGLTGPITAKGKAFNSIMPPQESQMTDQQIADAISYVRNSWGNNLGDVPVSLVTKVRAKYKDRTELFTAKDFDNNVIPKPIHNYNFRKSYKDLNGKAHAKLISKNPEQVRLTNQGVDLSKNKGERSNSIKQDAYIDLPNHIISKAAKSGVVGELTIEVSAMVSTNRPWAEIYAFGTSNKGENNSGGGRQSPYMILIPQNAQSNVLRFAINDGHKERFINGKSILKPNVMHRLVVTLRHGQMSLFLNGNLVGTESIPAKFDVTSFKNDNNWLGRSQYPDPLFDGIISELKIYNIALPADAIKLLK